MGWNLFHGSIRKKLVVLVMLATLPAFLGNLASELDNRERALNAARSDAEIYLQGFINLQQKITDSTRTLLQTVAAFPEIRTFNAVHAEEALAVLLEANPIYSNVILVDLNGNVVAAGKGGDEAKAFNFSDRKQFRDAVSSGRFSSGEFVVGKHTGISIFPFGMPVRGLDGKVKGAIIIGTNLSQYGELFDASKYPEGSYFGIADHRGVRVFKYPFSKMSPVGSLIKENIFKLAQSSKGAEVRDVVDSEDVERVLAYSPLMLNPGEPPYLYMFMAIDRQKALMQANDILYRGVFTTVGSLILALSIAWFAGGRVIAKRLEKLAGLARKLGRCDTVSLSDIDYSDGEIGHLAKTWDSMNRLLHEREIERNEALKRFSESEEQYRTLLEVIPAGVCLVEPESREVVFANHAFLKLLGLQDEQVGNVKVDQLHPHDKLEDVIEIFREHVEKGGGFSSAVPFQHRSGTEFLAEISTVMLVLQGRHLLAGFLIDTTERRLFEKQILDAKEAAENANAAKDEFLANISHEVRTPLNGVMGMLQLLKVTDLSREQGGYVDTGLQSSHSLMRVLDDLLDFSKIEAGILEVYSDPFKLKELLRECVELLKVQADEKGIELGFTILPSAKEQYVGDAGRIRQILFNLLGNAIKFTETGGVHIEVYTLPNLDPSKERLFFEVKDTGMGIPDDKVDYIFESFTQVDGSRSRKYQGVGLGLSIVKRLVSLMKGSMVIESRLGVGTRVLFCVLVEHGTCSRFTDLPVSEVRPGLSLKLLLVEDEAVNRLMAKKLLEKIGHRVVCAEDGEQCLEILGRENFDAILMDIQMPVMTGIEATRKIRSAPEFAEISTIPVIALTAHATKHDMDAAFDAGMDEYVTKPFEMDYLAETLARVVGRNFS